MRAEMEDDPYNEPVPIPRGGIRFPLELRPPPGFRPSDPATWPRAIGRLEYVGGRLLYMPPCGDDQQDVSASVTGVLEAWNLDHPEFVVGGNEAGMILDGEIRGADVAIWRRDALGDRGVRVVWLVFPSARELIVLTPDTETRYGAGDRIPITPELPELAPSVESFFWKLV